MRFGCRASSVPSCVVRTLLVLSSPAGRTSLTTRTPLEASLWASVPGSSSGPEIIGFVLPGSLAQGCIMTCAMAVVALFACCWAVTSGGAYVHICHTDG